MIYLDNILIYFKSYKKYWECERKMLERLYQFRFYAKLLKYFFMIQMIKFLEYIITNYEISMNSCRMKVIQTWFEIKTLCEM